MISFLFFVFKMIVFYEINSPSSIFTLSGITSFVAFNFFFSRDKWRYVPIITVKKVK